MAFTVEDGNGLEEANAYIDVAFADGYFTDRAITAWTGDEAVKQAAIIKATDYIDTVFGGRFLGVKFTDAQALEFPRYSACAVPEAPVALPVTLQKACAEYALRALSNALLTDPEVDASGLQVMSKTETVGPITEQVSFFNAGGIEITQNYPAADLLLKKLMRTSGTSIRG